MLLFFSPFHPSIPPYFFTEKRKKARLMITFYLGFFQGTKKLCFFYLVFHFSNVPFTKRRAELTKSLLREEKKTYEHVTEGATSTKWGK